MIYLCGDTHIPIDIKKLNIQNFPEQKSMTRNDYVIILGDFGLLWKRDKTYEHWFKTLTKKKFTILWLDGNHENFDWIESLPEFEWNGGPVHLVADNILHLERGYIYTIENLTFFVCGGAASYDKARRIPYESWWPHELLSYEEENRALDNLEKVNNTVDYVLTHTCPKSIINSMFNPMSSFFVDPVSNFLEEVYRRITFKDWYFGHWHEDMRFENFHCLYNNLIKLT